MSFILIVTKRADIHADLVIRRIRDFGGKFLRINGEDIPSRTSIQFCGPPISADLTIGDLRYRCDDIGCVWYRRRKEPEPSLAIAEISARNFARDENTAAYTNFLTLLRDRPWVNPLEAVERAKSKMYQLAVADSCGLKIPRTLVTSCSDELRSFFYACGRQVVYKPIFSGGVKQEGGRSGVIFTAKITEEMTQARGALALAPGIFQEYVPKRLELRVTVVGNQLFTAAIHSQEHERTQVDWRRYHPETRHTQHILDQETERRILTFMDRMGLSFGAIDMILTPDGDHVLLEVNQMGQWAWIERETKLPISTALAELLWSHTNQG